MIAYCKSIENRKISFRLGKTHIIHCIMLSIHLADIRNGSTVLWLTPYRLMIETSNENIDRLSMDDVWCDGALASLVRRGESRTAMTRAVLVTNHYFRSNTTFKHSCEVSNKLEMNFQCWFINISHWWALCQLCCLFSVIIQLSHPPMRQWLWYFMGACCVVLLNYAFH